MNKVFLRGFVGADPQVKTFENGGKIAVFTLATTERGFTTKDGKTIPDVTDWHKIVVRGNGLVGICEKYVKKGTPLLIEGKIHTRTYEDKNGVKKEITEVFVEELELLGAKKNENASQNNDYQPMGGDMPF